MDEPSKLDDIEKQGTRNTKGSTKLLVIFWTHDGYFHVPLAEEALCRRICRACESDEEISFTYDRELRILSVLD
jgi:hypothetical protein